MRVTCATAAAAHRAFVAESQVFEVVRICLPVFALVGIGWWLRRSGAIDQDGAGLINRLAFNLGLPAILVLAIAKQDLANLLEPAIILPSLAATVLGCALIWPYARRRPAEIRGVVLWMPFWANVSFLGFPLAQNAFGDAGLTYAAILNAFCMPGFVTLGIILLSSTGGEDQVPLRQRLKLVFLNPVLLAVVIGVVIAALGEWPWLATQASTGWLRGPLDIVEAIIALVGQMGLPLALFAVGAALKVDRLRGALGPLAMGSLFKLVITPLITLLLARWWFPEANPAAVGTAVILMAAPCGVAACVISAGMQRGGELPASHMVVSTVLAIVTLPVWVALVI